MDNRPYYKVVLPGWWYYTQDPPNKWWVRLYWLVALGWVFWPLWVTVGIAVVATWLATGAT